MNKRHRRALLWSSFVAVLIVPPVCYLALLYQANVLKGMKDLGPVEDFAYATADGTAAFTHYDTFKRVTFLLELPKDCIAEAKCQDALEHYEQIKAWADTALLNKNSYDPKPLHINFVVFSPKLLTFKDNTIKQIIVDTTQPYLLPKSAAEVNEPVFVAISQESRFAALLKNSEPQLEEKAKRMLASLTSDAYLFHYLTIQSLMWKRAKDYARGQISTGE